jgi:hypothetical protein
VDSCQWLVVSEGGPDEVGAFLYYGIMSLIKLEMLSMKRTVLSFALVIIGILLVGWAGKFAFETKLGLNNLPAARYVSAINGREVVQAADGLDMLTRVKLTPNEWAMFATTLDGKLWALKNLDDYGTDNGGKYVLQKEPVYQLELGWKPGSENGMTGLAVSYDFAIDHYVFVSYAKNVGGVGRNYIDRLTIEDSPNGMRVSEVKNIFVANTPVAGAHQIQGIITLPVEDKLHLMFAVGEAYHAKYAQDLAREAGKVMMIQADGSNPLGARPYPDFPKVQAIGIRNAYDLARNEASSWVYLTHNGADANDAILYAPLLDADYQIDFGWDGNDANLLKPKINGVVTPELVIHHWDNTVAPTDIAVDSLGRFYFNIFSSATYHSKEIWMGETNNNQELKLTKIAERSADAAGGNLLGLAISDLTGNIWFGDIGEGALYVLGRSWELVRVVGK